MNQDHDALDLVAGLSQEERASRRSRMSSISPDDGKYSSWELEKYLSASAEFLMCARVQREFLAARVAFGQAGQRNLDEVDKALPRVDPLNMSLLESEVTKHDQLAVIDEIGRFVTEETKALLHPGTTSYDILDTARLVLFKACWNEVMRPKVAEVISKLCALAGTFGDTLQVGRTHLQRTSPVLFGGQLAGYAARLAERVMRCDEAFSRLKGKLSGIVGTGASVEMVIGAGKAAEFEKAALARLGLEPDKTATQVVQKEALSDVGHALVSLMLVLGDFANDMRILYSSEINEVTARDAKKRLGGSSADAAKNNPINWENISGKCAIVESGMRVIYEMIQTDLQRDLRGSVQGRYQPHQMMAQVYESFKRASKALDQLSVNSDSLSRNLQPVRDFPSEAMVAILRKHGYTDPELGVGHDAVKVFARKAQAESVPLLEAALSYSGFEEFFRTHLSLEEQRILSGELELYLGQARARMSENSQFSLEVAGPLQK